MTLISHPSLSKILVNDSIIDKPPNKPTPPVPPRRHHGGSQSAATSTSATLPHQQLPPSTSYDLIKLEASYNNNYDRRGDGAEEDDATDDGVDVVERVGTNYNNLRDRDLMMMKNNNVINHRHHHQQHHPVLKHNNHDQTQPPIPTPRYKKEVVVSLDPLIYLIIFTIFFILNVY